MPYSLKCPFGTTWIHTDSTQIFCTSGAGLQSAVWHRIALCQRASKGLQYTTRLRGAVKPLGAYTVIRHYPKFSLWRCLQVFQVGCWRCLRCPPLFLCVWFPHVKRVLENKLLYQSCFYVIWGGRPCTHRIAFKWPVPQKFWWRPESAWGLDHVRRMLASFQQLSI